MMRKNNKKNHHRDTENTEKDKGKNYSFFSWMNRISEMNDSWCILSILYIHVNKLFCTVFLPFFSVSSVPLW